jgi:hypothetical protein
MHMKQYSIYPGLRDLEDVPNGWQGQVRRLVESVPGATVEGREKDRTVELREGLRPSEKGILDTTYGSVTVTAENEEVAARIREALQSSFDMVEKKVA